MLIRTLGASRKFITSSLNIEMASIGVMAGLLAALGTEVIGMALANWIFNMEMTLHPWLWIFGPIMGVLATWLASFHLVRQVVNEAPIGVLRRLS